MVLTRRGSGLDCLTECSVLRGEECSAPMGSKSGQCDQVESFWPTTSPSASATVNRVESDLDTRRSPLGRLEAVEMGGALHTDPSRGK